MLYVLTRHIPTGTGIEGYSAGGADATSVSMDCPPGIAVDSSGNLYITDVYNCLIRKVSISTGILTTFVGTELVRY